MAPAATVMIAVAIQPTSRSPSCVVFSLPCSSTPDLNVPNDCGFRRLFGVISTMRGPTKATAGSLAPETAAD